jgi:hypothetical protein
MYSGDPVTGQGWIVGPQAPDDRRFIMSSGPADIQPGDTQYVVIAQVIGRGTSNLNSITKMKEAVVRAQNLYNACFENEVKAGKPLISTYAPDNGKIYLTWDDNSEKQKLYNHFTNDFYNFEGYNIYQIKRGTDGTDKNDRILLATFDIKNNVKEIYDSIFLPEYNSWTYGKVQSGTDNGISRYIVIEKDHFADKPLYKGTPYYFAVTAYYLDMSAGAYSLSPKVIESNLTEQVIQVIPQNLTQGTTITYDLGDTIRTNRKDLGVKPVIIDPLKVISADYTSKFYRTNDTLSWKIIRTVNNNTTTIMENVFDFSGSQDTAKIIDGMMLLHSQIKDSGVVRDKNDPYFLLTGINNSSDKGWDYIPKQNQWIMGLDTQRLKTAKFVNRQFQSRSMSISWPYQGGTSTTSFRGLRTRVFANARYFTDSAGIKRGGPLRKVKIVFGETQKAYRFAHVENGTPVNVLLSDTAHLTNTPFIDMADIPFRIYEIDDLDSTISPRQLNAAFIDADANGLWDPDTTRLGKYQILYILASDYNEVPNQYYTIRNPGFVSPLTGFPSFDIIYAWMPRVKIKATGEPMTWTNGDELIIYPYIITRDEFVPGFNITYSWSTTGAEISNRQNAVFNNQIENVNVFPNPYYIYSGLESSYEDRFIYFSNLPAECTIYIYALNGTLVKKIMRNEIDPERSLERWDIKNDEGNTVASGMYIAAISAPGIGSKVLKLAVFNN